MPLLTELTLSDVHFGRAPLVDDTGYKDYILNHLPAVQILDGVLVTGICVMCHVPCVMCRGAHTLSLLLSQYPTPTHAHPCTPMHAHTDENRLVADQELRGAGKAFEASLEQIEADFRCEVQGLGARHKAKEGHCAMLEAEMSRALRDLQGLVQGARTSINAHTDKQTAILEANLKSLQVLNAAGISNSNFYVTTDSLCACADVTHFVVNPSFDALVLNPTSVTLPLHFSQFVRHL